MMINVEVVYALPQKQHILFVSLPEGSTVAQAIEQSGILTVCNKVDKVGIYGQLVDLATLVKQGDRIEIYRPLIADPKELRRQRALQQKNNR